MATDRAKPAQGPIPVRFTSTATPDKGDDRLCEVIEWLVGKYHEKEAAENRKDTAA